MPRIYAKVSIEMWGDKKFSALSPLRPSGQALWLYLLTGEFRTSIPGLSLRVGIGALADRLKWSTVEVERRWEEIASRQMGRADWTAGVVWLPRGIEHNEPESPNVIKGWGKLVLPECDLVDAAVEHLRSYIACHLKEAYAVAFEKVFPKAFHEGFSKAFPEGFRDTFEDTSPEGSPNQEQEQDQSPPIPPAGGGAPRITRRERKQAEGVLRDFRFEHRPVPFQRLRELQEAGLSVPDAPRCMHVPCCEDDEACVRRLVGEARARERRVG